MSPYDELDGLILKELAPYGITNENAFANRNRIKLATHPMDIVDDPVGSGVLAIKQEDWYIDEYYAFSVRTFLCYEDMAPGAKKIVTRVDILKGENRNAKFV